MSSLKRKVAKAQNPAPLHSNPSFAKLLTEEWESPSGIVELEGFECLVLSKPTVNDVEKLFGDESSYNAHNRMVSTPTLSAYEIMFLQGKWCRNLFVPVYVAPHTGTHNGQHTGKAGLKAYAKIVADPESYPEAMAKIESGEFFPSLVIRPIAESDVPNIDRNKRRQDGDVLFATDFMSGLTLAKSGGGETAITPRLKNTFSKHTGTALRIVEGRLYRRTSEGGRDPVKPKAMKTLPPGRVRELLDVHRCIESSVQMVQDFDVVTSSKSLSRCLSFPLLLAIHHLSVIASDPKTKRIFIDKQGKRWKDANNVFLQLANEAKAQVVEFDKNQAAFKEPNIGKAMKGAAQVVWSLLYLTGKGLQDQDRKWSVAVRGIAALLAGKPVTYNSLATVRAETEYPMEYLPGLDSDGQEDDSDSDDAGE